MKNVWLWLAAAGIGLVFGCLGGVLFQVLSALPQSITEDGLRAHCAAKNGFWIGPTSGTSSQGNVTYKATYSACTADSVTYTDGGRTWRMPQGHIYVWWNMTEGRAQIND